MVACIVAGCAATPRTTDNAVSLEMLALLMPSRVEIVEPFTRVKSFDGDAMPDGIELLLRAVNSLDNPGLMIVGDVRVELFEYVPASADRNQLTQMYEFRLGIDPAVIPLSEKYVLMVTYNSPLGDRLTDEYAIQCPAGVPSLTRGASTRR